MCPMVLATVAVVLTQWHFVTSSNPRVGLVRSTAHRARDGLSSPKHGLSGSTTAMIARFEADAEAA